MSLSPFIKQYNTDEELCTWPRPVWDDTKCGFCAQPVELHDALVFVTDYEITISYPTPGNARAFLCHNDCGPGAGYWIDLASLASPGEPERMSPFGVVDAESWRLHLRSKDWFSWSVADAIEKAHRLAFRLREEIRRQNEAPQPAKPYQVTQRPSRVPSNPRSISPRTRTRIMERDNFRCKRCGNGPSDARLVIDHIIPVANGGTADESNLQTLCHPCNAGKGARDPHPHDLGEGA